MKSTANAILNRLVVLLICACVSWSGFAKGYSSGGHSYSSHSSSSHSSFSSSRSSSGSRSSSSSSRSPSSSKSFRSSSGKNYSSGSNWNDSNRKGYSSSHSYSSDSGKTFRTGKSDSGRATPQKDKPDSNGFAFDTAAARARKEQASKEQFTQYKQSQAPRQASPDNARSVAEPFSDRGSPPIIAYGNGSYRRTVYVPDATTISTRPVRIYNVFNTYSARPWITYHDPYSSLFWWWLLDRSLDDRAWWAYHHRYDMDPARYDALLATDAQLQARVTQLEAQQAARDPSYVPPGLQGRDLMYSDQYVNRAYSNRPTLLGVIAFWVLGIPLALAICGFFIWLIWFKRWQTAT